MSPRMNAGMALLAVAACAAASIVWLRTRNNQAPDMVAHAGAAVENASAADTAPAKDFPGTTPKHKEFIGDAKPESAAGPVRAGETWDFTANVYKLSNVANLQVRVVDRRSFLGKTVWHLRATAHTENPLRMVFALDDQFDSYSDSAALTSLQYEMHLNERGQKVDSVQRMTTGGRAPLDATAAIVLPGTRDPLGMLQYLRGVDWTKIAEVRSPVYDGHKLYDVRARLAAKAEDVNVPAGSYSASKIELRVFDSGGEMKDSHFFLYLANDPARSPVLLDAQLPFADARVELVRSQTTGASE